MKTLSEAVRENNLREAEQIALISVEQARNRGADGQLAIALNDLALVYMMQARFSESELLLREALDAGGQMAGLKALVLASMGDVCRELAKYNEAEQRYIQAKLLCESTPSDPELLSEVLNSLASLYVYTGRYNEAEPICAFILQSAGDGALSIRAQSLAASTLGDLYYETARYSHSERFYKEALSLAQSLPDSKQLLLGIIMSNLGSVHLKQMKYEESRGCLEQSARIMEKVLGTAHPLYAEVIDGLGELACAEGLYEEAAALLNQAKVLREKVFGTGHPETAKTIHHLAELAVVQGRYEEAVVLWQKTAAIREAKLGSEHPRTLTARAGLLEAQSKLE